MDDITNLQIRVSSDQVTVANSRLGDLVTVAGRVEKSTSRMGSAVTVAMSRISDLTNIIRSSAQAARVLWNVFQQPIQTTRQFQILRAALTSSTGSVEDMTIAWGALMKFAEDTPFGIEQAVNGFNKLVNLGLEPSRRALMSYGDTSSAMGKDLEQMIEAVADAATMEFERLKEFGIKAKQETDKVIFTFQGVQTSVAKNAAAIEQYLIELGENNFAGAMAGRMETLDGKFAGLEDAWANFQYNLMTSTGAADTFGETLEDIAGYIEEINGLINSGELNSLWESQSHQLALFQKDLKGALTEVERLAIDVGKLLSISGDDWETYSKNIPLFIRNAVKSAGVELATLVMLCEETAKDMSNAFKSFPDEIAGYFKMGINTIVGHIQDAGFKAGHIVGSFNALGPSNQSATNMLSPAEIAEAAKINMPTGSGLITGGGLFPDARSQVDKALATKENSRKEFNARRQDILDRREGIYREMLVETVAGTLETERKIQEAKDKRLAAEAAAAEAAEAGDPLGAYRIGSDGTDGPTTPSTTPKKTAGGNRSSGISDFDKLVSDLQREEDAVRQSYDARLKLIQDNTAAGSAAQTELSLSLLSQYEEDRLSLHSHRQQEYDSLAEWLRAERDIIKESYEERRQIILSATELTEAQKLDALAKAQKQYASQMAASFQATSDEYLGAASNMFRDLASMGSTFGKTGFKIAQGAAIAEATVNMYSSAVAAYKSGASLPGGALLGPVFAAAALAAGAANIARIKSQTYSDGGYAGMFEHGGLIPAGKAGLVGEAGPEFVRGPAMVTSARATADSRKQQEKDVIIQIHNHSGQPVETKTSEDEHRKLVELIIGQAKRAVASDIQKGGGEVSRAVEGTYNMTRGKRVG